MWHRIQDMKLTELRLNQAETKYLMLVMVIHKSLSQALDVQLRYARWTEASNHWRHADYVQEINLYHAMGKLSLILIKLL